MHRFFVDASQIGGEEISITGGDVNHIKNVLRMEAGEQICVCSGQDETEYLCEIRTLGAQEVTAEILRTQKSKAELPSRITLFQGLPKSDKMELVIQKAVELGVYEIVPVATARAVVKLDAKKEAAKRKRWQAIAESAAKQSKRAVIPQILPVMSWQRALEYAGTLDRSLIPYELASGMAATREVISSLVPGQSVGIFIGPEGGFEETEVAQAGEIGAQAVTLGRRILRTETAGLATLAMLVYHLEDRG